MLRIFVAIASEYRFLSTNSSKQKRGTLSSNFNHDKGLNLAPRLKLGKKKLKFVFATTKQIGYDVNVPSALIEHGASHLKDVPGTSTVQSKG